MLYKAIITLIVALLNIIIGIIIFRKNPKNKSNIYYAALSISAGLWSLSMAALAYSNRTWEAANEWAYIFGILPPLFYLLFACHYPYQLSERPKFLLPLIYFVPVVLLLSGIFGIIDFISVTVVDGVYVEKAIWPGSLIFTVYFFIYILLALIVLFKTAGKVEGIYKSNIKYIIILTLSNFIITGTVSVFLPMINIAAYDWLGPISTLINVIFIGHLLFFRNR